MRNIMLGALGVLVNSTKETMMTNTASELQEQAVETTINAEQALWCPEQNLIIFGVELVSRKLINLIRATLLSEKEAGHGINVIRFTQDLPKEEVVDEQGMGTGKFRNVLADYDFESRAVIINLSAHFETAMDRIINQVKTMRVGAYIFANMLISIFHELFHSHKLIDADNPYLVNNDADCDDFERLGKELLIEMAKTVDIEAPSAEEESKVILEFCKQLEDDAIDCDDDWAKDYRVLLEKSIVYKDGDVEIPTLRLYYKRFAEGTGDTSNWPEAVHTITDESFTSVSEPTSISTTTPVVNPATPDFTEMDGEQVLSPDFGYDESAIMGLPEQGTSSATPQMPTVGQPAPVQAPVTPAPTTPATTEMPQVPPPAGLPAQGGTPQGLPQQQAQQPTLPVHNLSPEQKLTFIRELCLRLFDYLFVNCGYQYNAMANQGEAFPGFSNPNAVYGFVPVHDIPYAKEILTGVETVDEKSGQKMTVDIWNPQVTGWPAGCIRGIVWSKGDYTSQVPLPGYVLKLNLDGFATERSFIPQNPNKRYPDGNLRKWAQEARCGTMRGLLMDNGRNKDDRIQVTVTTIPDGSVVRQVVSNPFNKAYRRIL